MAGAISEGPTSADEPKLPHFERIRALWIVQGALCFLSQLLTAKPKEGGDMILVEIISIISALAAIAAWYSERLDRQDMKKHHSLMANQLDQTIKLLESHGRKIWCSKTNWDLRTYNKHLLIEIENLRRVQK